MNHDWKEALQKEPIDLTPRPGFEAQLREGLAAEWNGRPMLTPTAPNATPPHRRSTRPGWMLGAAAAATLVIGGVVIAVRQGASPTVQTPVTEPSQTTVPAPPTTAVEPATTASATTAPATTDAAPDSTVADTTVSAPTTAPPATSPPTDVLSITVPLTASRSLPLQPITTVGYGPGDEQVEVLNGEFPPPAVWHVGGVLVLEDAPQTGLTGDGVIVQTGPDSAFDDGTERRFQPVAIDVAEPGGTPIAVRSLDGGGIVVVTAHDDAPRIRIRQYGENPPGLFSEIGQGADIEALGDSQLRITADGATWGGDVVVPPNSANPDVARPIVTSDPPSGFSTSYTIERPAHDGGETVSWTLTVEFDEEFPPGSDSPLVEPFGDGALVVIQNSSAQFAQPIVVVLGGDGGGVTYDLDGWSIADVRPEGALLTRSTSDGLELATLRPTS